MKTRVTETRTREAEVTAPGGRAILRYCNAETHVNFYQGNSAVKLPVDRASAKALIEAYAAVLEFSVDFPPAVIEERHL